MDALQHAFGYHSAVRAMVMRAVGEPSELGLAELPDPTPGAGQIGVEVAASGCNFADILICRGAYQLKPAPPFSPGSEVAGTVCALGHGVADFVLGQRVAAQVGYGGYASRAIADVRRVQALPDAVPFSDACALGIAYQTAYLALEDRAHLRPGEWLLVHAAAGGVGLAAVQVARALGARVIAGAGDDKKLALCRKHGAHESVNTQVSGWEKRVLELTDGAGANVIYDSVGGEVFERSLKCIAWGGRLLAIGFSSGEIPTVRLNRVLLKHIALIGLNLGGYHEHEPETLRRASAALYELYAEGRVRPLIHAEYPLTHAASALAELAARRTVGKLILLP